MQWHVAQQTKTNDTNRKEKTSQLFTYPQTDCIVYENTCPLWLHPPQKGWRAEKSLSPSQETTQPARTHSCTENKLVGPVWDTQPGMTPRWVGGTTLLSFKQTFIKVNRIFCDMRRHKQDILRLQLGRNFPGGKKGQGCAKGHFSSVCSCSSGSAFFWWCTISFLAALPQQRLSSGFFPGCLPPLAERMCEFFQGISQKIKEKLFLVLCLCVKERANIWSIGAFQCWPLYGWRKMETAATGRKGLGGRSTWWRRIF